MNHFDIGMCERMEILFAQRDKQFGRWSDLNGSQNQKRQVLARTKRQFSFHWARRTAVCAAFVSNSILFQIFLFSRTFCFPSLLLFNSKWGHWNIINCRNVTVEQHMCAQLNSVLVEFDSFIVRCFVLRMRHAVNEPRMNMNFRMHFTLFLLTWNGKNVANLAQFALISISNNFIRYFLFRLLAECAWLAHAQAPTNKQLGFIFLLISNAIDQFAQCAIFGRCIGKLHSKLIIWERKNAFEKPLHWSHIAIASRKYEENRRNDSKMAEFLRMEFNSRFRRRRWCIICDNWSLHIFIFVSLTFHANFLSEFHTTKRDQHEND